MQLSNRIFRQYIENMTSASTRSRCEDCSVEDFHLEDGLITAVVRNPIGLKYDVEVDFSERKITQSLCSCDFSRGPVCEHIVAVLVAADAAPQPESDLPAAAPYFIAGKQVSDLSHADIFKHSTEQGIAKMNTGRRSVFIREIAVNNGSFLYSPGFYHEYAVQVVQRDHGIELSCNCTDPKTRLCEHQTVVLTHILESNAIRLFFDDVMRRKVIQEKALDYGLENEADLDRFFRAELENEKIRISPLLPELMPLNRKTTERIEKHLLPKIFSPDSLVSKELSDKWNDLLLIGSSPYSRSLYLKLYEAQQTKEGKLKNPLRLKNPLDYVLKTEQPDELRFYASLAKFQQEYRSVTPVSDMEPAEFSEELSGVKAILRNPKQLPVFRHDTSLADTITVASITPVTIDLNGISLALEVKQNDVFYEITGTVEALNKQIPVERVQLIYRFFLLYGTQLVLIDHFDFLRTIEFLKTHNNKIIIHESKFEEFREQFLTRLESKVSIQYAFIKAAPQKVIEQTGLNVINERLIFLTDSDNFVLITPAMRYGDVEIPVLSERQIYTLDQTGTAYSIDRDKRAEQEFLQSIHRMHPDFQEQPGNEFFYLHKQEFLDEAWFLDAFEHWNERGYTILGFSSLKNNQFNPNKMQVTLHVSSEIDWFDTSARIRFGQQEVTLKQIQKSINNKSRYVRLGDGTMGVMPTDWIEQFAKYFRSGDISEDRIRIPKSQYALIDQLYDDEILSEEVRRELAFYKEKVSEFERIQSIEPPATLKATLRDYQKEGLNWLNFLDEFGFGGCLADDMGLGKTVQVLAFILSQREKRGQNTNLIVVPTSLIFNWIAEVQKFAPSLNVLTIHGNTRVKNSAGFDQYDIILTSYGTLLSDIHFLKKYAFNYIFLDESQAIKNPESKRYKSVRLLQARNRIVLTGTPIENNTFDLYAQLSFAVPGLLGSPKLFSDNYAMPIDKFKDSKRAKELQQKINPFLLRRTKKQVASELPEKTEMVIYCEMGAEQRKVYDTYRDEFQRFLSGMQSDEYSNGNMHILQGLTKLRQICNSPALLSDQEYYGSDSSKMNELIEQITSKSQHHKILVFSQFVGMLDLIRPELQSRGISFAYLTGKTKNRAQEVERFQSDADVRVFLISLKAGGTGLNLTEADYVYIIDPWWNPAVENQAIDRCYRIGQQKNVMAIRLICPDTIEEKMLRLQETKKELVNDLIHTDNSVLKVLTREDLLRLVE